VRCARGGARCARGGARGAVRAGRGCAGRGARCARGAVRGARGARRGARSAERGARGARCAVRAGRGARCARGAGRGARGAGRGARGAVRGARGWGGQVAHAIKYDARLYPLCSRNFCTYFTSAACARISRRLVVTNAPHRFIFFQNCRSVACASWWCSLHSGAKKRGSCERAIAKRFVWCIIFASCAQPGIEHFVPCSF